MHIHLKYFIIIWLFCFATPGCTTHNAQENNSNDVSTNQFETDTLELTDTNKQVFPSRGQLPVCEFDSLSFVASMGKGVAEIHYTMLETTYYNSPHLSDSIGKLFQDKRQLYLQFNKDTLPIDWFLYPTEYREGSIIVLQTQKNAIQLKVNGLPDSLECWIEIKQSAKGKPFTQIVDWKTYLSHQTLWISKAQLSSNPMKLSPSDTADTVNFDYTYPIFQMHAYKTPWLLLSTLRYKSNGYDADTMSEPLGWYKWYCDDTLQLGIPSFYDLEYFYSPTYEPEK